MRRFVPLSLIALAACSPSNPSANKSEVDINAAAEAASDDVANYAAANEETAVLPGETAVTPAPAATQAPLNPPAPGTPGGLPDDRTPVSEAPFTPDSAQGGANVVQTYYALIGEQKYRQAWALWDNGGQASGISAAAFAASFDKYSEYHANVGAPGDIDAGAGQRYVTVPVQVYGRLKTGTPVYMIGSVVLHRTGDIDGATGAQRSWRIKSADIKPRPGQGPVAGTNPAPDVTARYRCIDGNRLQVRFDNKAETATVRSGGALLGVLKGQRPASGIWYKGQGYELRGKGDDATFTKPHLPPLACKAIDRG